MPAQRPLVGIAMVMVATLIFACMDTTTKHLVGTYNVPAVMAVRYIVSLVLMTAVLGPSHGRRLVRTNRTLLAILRGASLTASSLCALFSYRYLPVAEATAVIYLAPFGVLVLAGPLLGERVGLTAWLAVAIGFAGMLLVVRPGGGLEPVGILFALAAAAINIVYFLLSRLLASTETTVSLLYYSLLVGALAYGPLLPWTAAGGPMPDLLDAALLVAVGVMGVSGHFLITAAYREAPASLLTPINYFHILWAGVLGAIVFGHVPDALSLLGILFIAGAGASIGIASHRSSRKAALALATPTGSAPDALPVAPDEPKR